MDRRTVKLSTRQARQRAHALIDAAPEGYVCTIGEETRTQEQNRLRFLNALGIELRFLPELEGAGMFPVGQRSSTLTKRQFSGLIELLFAYGAKHGVRWSDKSQGTAERMAA